MYFCDNIVDNDEGHDIAVYVVDDTILQVRLDTV